MADDAPRTQLAADAIQHRLIAWQRRFGRHDLPWQQPPTPYRVWISEIMLQQTRVETVIPYFLRFTAQLPSVAALAAADLETVLNHWAGLGYYARARNLHAAAQRLMATTDGAVPAELAELEALPGIGPSTAGAIRSLGHGRPAAILDGNVKRVLARLTAFAEWPGRSPAARRLWQLSTALIPSDGTACRHFNQGLMDLGAGVCTPHHPDCPACPLATLCAARAEGAPQAYPRPRPPRPRPQRTTRLLIIADAAGVLLERRPPTGIWGGLWSLPECRTDADPLAHAERLGVTVERVGELPPRNHAFTHFELELRPLHLRTTGTAAPRVPPRVAVHDLPLRWYRPGCEPPPALAAPIARILHAPPFCPAE